MTIHNFDFGNSSMLSNCSYDDITQELTVTFTNGRSYTYEAVSINTYQDLTNAASAGKYFNQIKNNLKAKT